MSRHIQPLLQYVGTPYALRMAVPRQHACTIAAPWQPGRMLASTEWKKRKTRAAAAATGALPQQTRRRHQRCGTAPYGNDVKAESAIRLRHRRKTA